MTALAYHLVWTTYGTWLPGDVRGWVMKNCESIQSPDAAIEQAARARMSESEVMLTPLQRQIVEQTIRRHCEIRNWRLHAVNVRSNHIHVVVTADREPEEVINQLKAWCSRKLSDTAGLKKTVADKAGRRRWFTEGGDKEVIEDDNYLENAIQYVREGQ